MRQALIGMASRVIDRVCGDPTQLGRVRRAQKGSGVGASDLVRNRRSIAARKLAVCTRVAQPILEFHKY